jgi:hypothetical protein
MNYLAKPDRKGDESMLFGSCQSVSNQLSSASNGGCPILDEYK